jgi:hypothetical protein
MFFCAQFKHRFVRLLRGVEWPLGSGLTVSDHKHL